MMAYDNTNSGALFKNQRKESERHPDYNGSVEVKCACCNEVTPYWLSAWVKEAGPTAKNPGQKFFSLALSEKEEKKVGNKKITNSPVDSDLEEDDIPF
jgi:hypothetical protein